jgi:hypothetical protein
MKRIRKALVVVLLLAYTGQLLAGVVTFCPEMAPRAAVPDGAGMSAMDHAGHAMKEGPGSAHGDNGGGCCDGAQCDMSHCQSAPALPLDHADSSRAIVGFYSVALGTSAPLRTPDALYRPPISR